MGYLFLPVFRFINLLHAQRWHSVRWSAADQQLSFGHTEFFVFGHYAGITEMHEEINSIGASEIRPEIINFRTNYRRTEITRFCVTEISSET